jgi:hypothetical protein
MPNNSAPLSCRWLPALRQNETAMLPTLTAALLAAAIAQSPLQYAGMRGSDLIGRGGGLDNLGPAIVQSLPGVERGTSNTPLPISRLSMVLL